MIHLSLVTLHKCIVYFEGYICIIKDKFFFTFRNAKIGISELFTPKVKYGIHNAKLKTDGHELFKNYQEDDIRFIVNNASLTLRCNLCDLMFSGPYATIGAEFHFSNEHPHDEKLFCSTCMSEIDFKYICGLRWAHVCIPSVK